MIYKLFRNFFFSKEYRAWFVYKRPDCGYLNITFLTENEVYVLF